MTTTIDRIKCDSGKINGITELWNGAIIVRATIAQVGWLEYLEQGERRLEYVSEEVLFEKEHFVTLRGLVTVLDHSPEIVTPDNHMTYSRGNTIEPFANKSKGTIEIDIRISERKAIDAVTKDKTHLDTSMGYISTDIPRKEGGNRWNQTKRRGYELALVTIGRASKAKLHVDKQDSLGTGSFQRIITTPYTLPQSRLISIGL